MAIHSHLIHDGFITLPEPPYWKHVSGVIEFTKVDGNSIRCIVTYNDSEKQIKGWEVSFEEFNKLFRDYKFTIMDEFCGYNMIIFGGFITCEHTEHDCSMRIYCNGEMKYITDEE